LKGEAFGCKLSELLEALTERVRDVEERVRAIEYMHWGVADIGRRVQVFDGDSEEGRKILEEVKQKGRLIDRSEGSGVIVEVYDT
jgi:biotin-(acetyl-CoA carboxylase) ligase